MILKELCSFSRFLELRLLTATLSKINEVIIKNPVQKEAPKHGDHNHFLFSPNLFLGRSLESGHLMPHKAKKRSPCWNSVHFLSKTTPQRLDSDKVEFLNSWNFLLFFSSGNHRIFIWKFFKFSDKVGFLSLLLEHPETPKKKKNKEEEGNTYEEI